MKTIRILLADDHTIVRKGLRMLLESHEGFQVVAEASNGLDAVGLAAQHLPDVVVMDVGMPVLNGIEAARQIGAKETRTAIVFLSMHSDESYVLRALKSGARGYLLKDSAEHDLIHAVETVSEGKAFFSPAISKMLVEDYVRQMREQKVEDSYELLTSRERQVLQVLAEGRSNKEVARTAGPEPAHGGDAPREHHAEAEPAQRRGDYSLRGQEGDHLLRGLGTGDRGLVIGVLPSGSPTAPAGSGSRTGAFAPAMLAEVTFSCAVLSSTMLPRPRS